MIIIMFVVLFYDREEASGFCYVNDIVIAIIHLLNHYKRVLYVDLDIHHGDGVQDAFYFSPAVFTLSFHKYCVGFFPGTGTIEEIGDGSGFSCCLNVPLEDGITDMEYVHIFQSTLEKVHKAYHPQVLVVQCGADCLAGDPLGSFNLTLNGVGNCLEQLLCLNLPTLLLGGGGYHFPNVAKCWTYLTSVAAGVKLPIDIPEHKVYK
jgi:histone deacetylase 8